ncbi:MAG: helix-turn-helix transcriptional regulator [Lachnospiraceae bacterium]|nr:helix-turn-helix transcriptional regulator [Lachnospiraceae bacterium]
MQDLKFTIAKNIQKLRQEKGMTQLDLAEKINYSDKTVSKWERGESLPDIVVLKSVADLFGVTLDYLVEEVHNERPLTKEMLDKNYRRNCYIITGTSIFIVALMATLIYVILAMIFPGTRYPWLCYAYAIPVAFIVWLVFNSIWFNPRKNFMIVSLLVWSLLIALYFTFWMLGFYIWPIVLVGIPAQIIIWMWSKIKNKIKI